jgi:RimJ/RimL family protein N-acetyltransferase
MNSSEEVMRYIRPVKNREEAKLHFAEVMDYSTQNPLYGRWAAIEKTSGVFAGSFAVIPVENTPNMQLGYSLLAPFWGKGYATELTKAGIEYVFTNTELQLIYAYTEGPNIASQKVLLKCGFKQVEIKKVGEKDLVEFIIRK